MEIRRLTRSLTLASLLFLPTACAEGSGSPEAAATAFLEAVCAEDAEAVLEVLVPRERTEGMSWGFGENPEWELGRVEEIDEDHAVVHATLWGHTQNPVACERVEGRWYVSYAESMRVLSGM